jgi:cytochrome P450
LLERIRIARLLVRLQSSRGRANPYPIYRKIQERAPVLRFGGQWSLSSHRHASLIRDPRFVIRVAPDQTVDESSPWLRVASDFLLFLDPPDHTRVRELVTSAFTPRAVESWRSRITEIVDELTCELQKKDRADIIADFAYPLPVRVICELLGLPSEYRNDFKTWSRAIAPAFDNQTQLMSAANAAVSQMVDALTDIVASRRRTLGDDLLSSLVMASDAGEKLDTDELLANLVLLFFGGHETTVNLIGNGMLALLRHPDQWEALNADPSLARGTVEEALRYDSPVQATSRRANSDLEIEGHHIRAGESVNFIFGAANRDPDVFVDPDTFDITRENAAQHLAFGGGGHYCVGARLARLEGEIAFAALAAALPNARLAVTEPEWREMFILRGMKSLPIALNA